MRDQPMEPDRDERFEALVPEVIDPIRGYLSRRTDPITAEDVLAETLLVLWRHVDDVPADAPVAWSLGVARLQLRNAERAMRRRGRLVQRILSVDPPAPAVAAGASEESGEGVRRVLSLSRVEDQREDPGREKEPRPEEKQNGDGRHECDESFCSVLI